MPPGLVGVSPPLPALQQPAQARAYRHALIAERAPAASSASMQGTSHFPGPAFSLGLWLGSGSIGFLLTRGIKGQWCLMAVHDQRIKDQTKFHRGEAAVVFASTFWMEQVMC